MPVTKSDALSAEQKRGLAKRARDRAEARAVKATGKTRIRAADWYPEIMDLDDRGFGTGEIAEMLRLSDRRIQQIRSSDGHNPWEAKLSPPKETGALSPELRAMLDFSPESFRLFFERFSGLKLSDHGYQLVAAALGHTNCIINVPPRHAKTTILAVWLPIWLLCRNRDEQILIVSQSNGHAKEVAASIAAELEWNKDIIDAFGRFAPDRQKSSQDSPWRPAQGQMTVLGRSKGGFQFSVLSRGRQQQILGREATWVIIDDVTDPEQAGSETERSKLDKWIKETVLTRLQPGGHALVVGQRVHLDDIYGSLAEQVGVRGPKAGELLWDTVVFPAVLHWPGELGAESPAVTLWPDVWDYPALMDVYDRLGHDSFEKMFQQNPRPEGGRFVEPEWLERCRDYDREGLQGIEMESTSKMPVVRVVSLDPSPTATNALVAADVVRVRGMFGVAILEVKTWKGNMRDFVREMKSAITHYAPDYVIIERSTVSNWLIQDPLYEEIKGTVRVLEHHTGRNKGDAELGVQSLAADFEGGRIRTPFGDELGQDMTRALEAQALNYGTGRPDDILMALWFIKWNYKRLRPRDALGAGQVIGGGRNAFGYIKTAIKDRERMTRRTYRAY